MSRGCTKFSTGRATPKFPANEPTMCRSSYYRTDKRPIVLSGMLGLRVFRLASAEKDLSAWAEIEDFTVGAIRFASKTAAATVPD